MADEAQPKRTVTYAPEFFNVADENIARRVILTPDFGKSTDERWTVETPYLADRIGEALRPTEQTLLLDYGCGIGRIAKALIERHGCQVIGVDISHSMRALAHNYVASDRFAAISPATFATLLDRGLAFDGAIAIWVLQHCFNPEQDIAQIRRSLKKGTGFFVVNDTYRCVPTREQAFVNDGIDMLQLLGKHFRLAGLANPRDDVRAPEMGQNNFMALFANLQS